MRLPSGIHLVACLSLPLVPLLVPSPPAAAGEVVTVDGVPHVRNAATPPGGTRTVRLEELWRVGGDDDAIFFGLITKVLADELGNIYILDSQLAEVQVYSPGGEHLGTLFREGEGPGEVTQPRDMVLLDDGTVGVIKEFPGTLIRVDRDNTPVSSIRLGGAEGQGFVVVDGCFAGGGTLVCAGTFVQQPENGIQDRFNYLSIFSREGEELHRLTEQLNRRDFNNFVIHESLDLPAFFWACCVGADGRVYAAPHRDRYAVEIHAPDGTLERVVERDYRHYRRSAEERQRFHDAIESVLRNVDIEIGIDVEENDYDILAMQHGVRIREDGTLWILPSRGVRDQPPGVMLTFDVFDREGHFTEQVAVAADHDGVWDGLFFVGPDRAVVVTGHVEALFAQYGGGANTYDDGDEAAMEVICYRVVE
jgi:hypothetical protein